MRTKYVNLGNKTYHNITMTTTMKTTTTTTKNKQNEYEKWYLKKILNELRWFTEQESALIGLNYYAQENYDIGDYEEEKDKKIVSEEATYYIDEMNNCLRTMYDLYLQGIETAKIRIQGDLIIPMTFIKNWCNGMYDEQFKNLEVYSDEAKLLKSTDL